MGDQLKQTLKVLIDEAFDLAEKTEGDTHPLLKIATEEVRQAVDANADAILTELFTVVQGFVAKK